MKVLEIVPLEDKILNVLIVEREYNEPFWLVEPPSDLPSKTLSSLFRPSIAFCRFLETLVKKIKPSFATEELGMRPLEDFYKDNALTQLFQRNSIPFFPVDIDENAKAYLAANVEQTKRLRDRVLESLDKLSKQREKGEETSVEEEYLVAYGQSLQLQLEEEQQEVNFPVRENWIVMGILDNARKMGAKGEEITCFHISSPEHVNGVKKILESLDIRVELLQLSKKIFSTYAEVPHTEELTDLLQSMQIQVKPIVKRTSEDAPYILVFLNTDKRASPFDICMAYDAGFNTVIPYDNVTPKDAKEIVQDTIFSRTKKGIGHTCFFIGGKNDEKAREVLEAVKNAMFPPFETTIISDPGGAYTTAAAMVAKVEDAVQSHNLGSLKDKCCAVFGTGSVGRIGAILLARLGCDTMIMSINPNRTDGEEYVAGISKQLLEMYGVNVQGVFAPTPEKKVEILKRADVIFCMATEGVRVIEADMLKELRLMKVMADINVVPPLGIEGIKLEDDMREMAPGIFGIGALTIGKLKHEVEMEILKEARRDGKGIYDYNFALKEARKLLQKEISPAKLTLTLKYPR